MKPQRGVGAPIALQLLALLAGGLIVAQLATIVLVLALPPQPPQVYRLGEIAAALTGGPLRTREGRVLSRSLHAAPPLEVAAQAGFPERDRRFLAELVGVSEADVRFERRRSLPLVVAGARLDPGLRRQRQNLLVNVEGPPRPSEAPRFGVIAYEGREIGLGGDMRRPFVSSMPVVGDFIAAVRQPGADRWVVVEPASPPFLSDWQRRVLFWFAGCLLVLAPVAYLFARRITAPIRAFARAAERIGRDPTAPLIELSGPAEIGVAAQAMNEMQVRLKRYVQDRTASIAAVSHDLRTPLARMRFKLEKAPPDLRASLSRDVDQMEDMVRAVLEFIREGSEPRRRERIDLLSVLECVVDDAAAAGAEAEIVTGEPVTVEADSLGLSRLFANLVENASKYGRRARVSVRRDGGEGLVEVFDEGPGLPDAELERVFQPFYRVEPSRNRQTGGVGLGLAVARSIARAHGGDVVLARGEPGLVARVRLPCAPA